MVQRITLMTKRLTRKDTRTDSWDKKSRPAS
jgi:hypothetical protein